MEENTSFIPIHYTDDQLIPAPPESTDPATGRYTRHFTQTEDFFLKFNFEYYTPRFKIHHDIGHIVPDPGYRQALSETLARILPHAPEVFSGLTYFFDPQEIFKPCFFRLYESDGALFFYLLRLDFGFRPNYQTIVERGDNDHSHICRTNALFLEPLLIPILGQEGAGDGRRIRIRTFISQTWIGEYGRGYFRQGIWIDNDLTKFFSRVLLEPEQRPYPYYPLLCHYQTVCAMPVLFHEAARLAAARSLGAAIAFLAPALPGIQQALRRSVFSESLGEFQSLRARADPAIGAPWRRLSMRTYLNETGMKEYQLDELDPTDPPA